jgi:hypothetical protein
MPPPEMQWLIDIAVERIWSDIYANGIYRDRGDPAAWDYKDADFTTDASWHDLDLSPIVPEHAKAVALFLGLLDNATGSYFQLRTKGNANTYNTSILRTQVANLYTDADLILALPASRTLQYRAANRTFTAIRLCVKAWWF